MELAKDLKQLIQIVNSKVNTQNNSNTTTSKLTLPSKDLSLGELAQLLNILAHQYDTTLPVLIRKLDQVSGDIRALDKIFVQKDDKLAWTQEEDDLLNKNNSSNILHRYKGEEVVQLRKRYLQAKKSSQKQNGKYPNVFDIGSIIIGCRIDEIDIARTISPNKQPQVIYDF